MSETIGPSRRTFQRAETDQAQFLKRWLSVWVALLTVVVVVVVVFLLKITDSLSSIDDGLADADSDVTGAGADVGGLPGQVSNINASLNEIDPVLKPIPDQAVAILTALQSINGKLVTTDGSLKDTGGNLRSIVGQAVDISNLLINADDPPDGFGVANIHQRVAFANGVASTGRFGTNPSNLTLAEAQAGNILAGLVDTNRHLVGICNSTAAAALNGGARC